MSNINLGLTTSHAQSDTKETASSIKKLNTWSTPFVFNNDCIKKIMEFCNVHQIFRLGCVNRHCNHIVSTTYSRLAFHLYTLHANFTLSGSFISPLESSNSDENMAWNDYLKRQVVFKNGKLKKLKYDVWTTVGEDQNILIKTKERTIKIEDRNNGKCLDQWEIMTSNDVSWAFRISKNNFIIISSTGAVDKYERGGGTCLNTFAKFNMSVSKAFLVKDNIYLLGNFLLKEGVYFFSKGTYENHLSLICFNYKQKFFLKKAAILSKGSTYCDLNTQIVNCIANKTHIFIVFQYGVNCYDNQNNLIWKKNDAANSTNENAILELNDKFLLISSYGQLNGEDHQIFKVYNITDGEFRHLKVKKTNFFVQCPERFNFWGAYILSQQTYFTNADIELWNPNNGQLIIKIRKDFIFQGDFLWPLKDNEGLIGLSKSTFEKEKNFFQKLFNSSEPPKELTKYELFLLKPNKKIKKA